MKTQKFIVMTKRFMFVFASFLFIGLFCSCTDEAPLAGEIPARNELTIMLSVVHKNQPASGTWSVRGKDSDGKIVDYRSGKFQGTESSIKVDAGLKEYAFILNANDIFREFTIAGEALVANPTLVVGLNDSDYHQFTTKDGNVTVLLPRDPTNPYLEIRVRAPEKIAYCLLDRGFWKDSLPVHDVLYRRITRSEIDNITFKPYIKFKDGYGSTWNEADALLFYDSYETGYEEIHHVWEF